MVLIRRTDRVRIHQYLIRREIIAYGCESGRTVYTALLDVQRPLIKSGSLAFSVNYGKWVWAKSFEEFFTMITQISNAE